MKQRIRTVTTSPYDDDDDCGDDDEVVVMVMMMIKIVVSQLGLLTSPLFARGRHLLVGYFVASSAIIIGIRQVAPLNDNSGHSVFCTFYDSSGVNFARILPKINSYDL